MQSEDSGSDEWDGLETIQTFDTSILRAKGQSYSGLPGGGPATPPVLLTDTGSANSASTPVSLLVESLVQQLCNLLEQDSGRSRSLYESVCEKLESMQLIDSTWAMNEFDVVRSQYQAAMVQLVSVAKGQDLLPSPGADDPQNLIWPLPLPVGMDWSRYHREFEELSFIAGGGFGKVYRARNKLDQIVYAVKKVIIKAKSIKHVMSHFSEVKTLASLNHVNIVPYKTAWLEPYMDTIPGDPVNVEEGEEEDDDENEMDDSVYSTEAEQKRAAAATKQKRTTTRTAEFSDSILFQNSNGDRAKEVWSRSLSSRMSFQTEEVSSKAVCAYASKHKGDQRKMLAELQPHLKLKWAVLYIQMSECQLTMRSWLDDRNQSENFSEFYRKFLASGLERNLLSSSLPSPSGDPLMTSIETDNEPSHLDVVDDIFGQLISGLEFIHSRNIVHHDIKPSNIFVSVHHSSRPSILVQLGDFGLACPLQNGHSNKIVGTPLYAAPEQIKGLCDKKNDIYSLGLILLELLVPTTTYMERDRLIRNVKNNEFPDTISDPYPTLIRRLVSRDLKDRPNSHELLETFGNYRSLRDPVVENLHKKVFMQDAEIAELKALVESVELNRNLELEVQSRDDELSKKDKEIRDLKLKLAAMEAIGLKSKRMIQQKHHETRKLKKKLEQRGSGSDTT